MIGLLSVPARCAWLMVVVLTPAVSAQVIISEIMYNPASNEQAPNDVEWLEIYNPTDQPIDISGYYLEDEDAQSGPIPEDTTLAAHTAVVLIPVSQTLEDFQAAWGEGFAIYPLEKWGKDGIFALANQPSADNEILTLRDGNGQVVDEVNYDDQDPWPSDKPQGPSIYLAGEALNAASNDLGGNWQRSRPGTAGARIVKATADFNGDDVGSPGVVETGDLDNS